ncbi:septum formation inhibitor-activating ATPase MinD [Arthrobacter sp. UYP6]|uniref:ATPase n=1 Tax=Arthrobacter sp. UYP6 TaxID=1756378 RepID=UPI0033971F07
MSRSTPDSEVLFIGGRSGVGKSTTALELHALLTRLDIRHAVIEGDTLDLAYPAPWKEPSPWPQGLAAVNLAAIWGNYRTLGYRRLIYTNTVAVRETAELAAAMGEDPRVHAVLLRASDAGANLRLGTREAGSTLQEHIARSRNAAIALDRDTPAWVHRIDTDNLSAADVARRILDLTGWASPVPAPATG